MDLEKAKRIYEDNQDIRARVPRLYMIGKTNSGHYPLTDHRHFIPTRREWEVAKLLIQDFYDNFTDEEIKKINKETEHHIYEQYAGQVSSNRKKQKNIKDSGYVYFLKADNGLIKIGRSKNLDKRLDHFTTKLPYKLKLVHQIKTNDTNKLEKHFHELYSNRRIRGEWFDLSNDTMQEIKDIYPKEYIFQ